MAKVRHVEDRIFVIERFRVEILDAYGRNIRSDKEDMKPYKPRGGRAMPDRNTVNDWKERRFHERYGTGYTVRVLRANRRPANGGMLLGTLRDEYP